MKTARVSTALALFAVGALAAIGGWQRRWMSDDGLIVLRTVRNLQEGHGPVFNIGERVEANTSVLWQYLILIFAQITPAGLETAALYLALGTTVAAAIIGVLATARLYRAVPGWVLPCGGIIYFALSPARDFATSGLEWGLSLFYLAVLWWFLVQWRYGQAPYWLAWWCGMSWLIRPELALYGAIVGLILLCAHRTWKQGGLIMAAALPIPLAYQIFRMGYYGVLTPHTAVAKSAADSAWGSGVTYLGDFMMPYLLFIPLALVLFISVDRIDKLHKNLRTTTTVVSAMLLCGLLHILYILRVGGDFMHGRMLLIPLFAMLLPVSVVVINRAWTAVGLALIYAWSTVVLVRGHDVEGMDYMAGAHIVDERDYWTQDTASEGSPMTATDFLTSAKMEDFPAALNDLTEGDALAMRYSLEREEGEGERFAWDTLGKDPEIAAPPTLYLINLGMSSANAPLEVRVLDTIGLATPLAARQPRIVDGRIGHDKSLPFVWQIADSAADINDIPAWVDPEAVRQARQALQTETFQELFATYREPMSLQRFVSNIKYSLTTGRNLELSKEPADYLN